jgi:diguanylate cyclase (GGDEF)-like protein/PAS domain S-box-containing protein
MVSKRALLRAAVPPELRSWVDNRLVSAHRRIIKPMVLGNLLNIAVIMAVLQHEVPQYQLGLFGLLMTAAAVLRIWRVGPHNRARAQQQPRAMLTYLWQNSLVTGIIFGTSLAVWLPVLSPPAQLLLGISAVSQIAAAAHTIRTIPRAAISFNLTVTAGLIVGLAIIGHAASWAAIALLIPASVLLARMTLTAYYTFVARILHDRELAASTRTVKMLLSEYQDNSSDWLFELDSEGRFTRVSQRFAAEAGVHIEDLEGLMIGDLFAPGNHRNAMLATISAGRPTRLFVMRLAAEYGGDSGRWWSITGRPCVGAEAEGAVYRGVIADVTSQRLAERRVHNMANFDALTGLPNRAMFNNTLAEILEARTTDDRVTLLLIDLDHFKAVNDMYGHPVGDSFLKAVGERLIATLEASGLGGERRLVARLGGDEFAIVISSEDGFDQSVRLADTLITAMGKPLQVGDNNLDCGISIGIAIAPDHAEMPQQLLSNADIALYAAKGLGRGTWEMFAPGMDAALQERLSLTKDLRQAVSNGELRLFLQPLVDLQSEERIGYEALLRWEHPERGLIAPDQFIPIAEETGLIVPIGEWVIRTAFAQAAGWLKEGTIAINLSPLQLGHPGLLPVIVQALAETGLDPARVEFEITEGVLLHNSEANIAVLTKLHDLGMKVALDDFGTGYASLNYLLTFPFDKIKIDRSFVRDLETREESQAIIGAVIALANQLGMCTLAEGVEDAAQAAMLKEQGCRMVQGWLFGKAQPSEHYHPHEQQLPERSALAKTILALPKISSAPQPVATTIKRRAAG